MSDLLVKLDEIKEEITSLKEIGSRQVNEKKEAIKIKTIEIRLEGIKSSVSKTRFTFVVMIIACVSILIALWNSYVSWDRDFALKVRSPYFLSTDSFEDVKEFIDNLNNNDTKEKRFIHAYVISENTERRLAGPADDDVVNFLIADLNNFLKKEIHFSDHINEFALEELPTHFKENYLYSSVDDQMKLKRIFLEKVFPQIKPFQVADSENASRNARGSLTPIEDGYNYNRKVLVSEWVKNSVVSVGLLGIRVGTNDLAVVGGSALLIITMWFVFNARRDNRSVWSLFRDLHSGDYDWETKYMAYQVVEQSMIFLDTGKGDDPVSNIAKVPFYERDFEEEFKEEDIRNAKSLRKKIFFMGKNTAVGKAVANIENSDIKEGADKAKLEEIRNEIRDIRKGGRRNNKRSIVNVLNFIIENEKTLFKSPEFQTYIPSNLKNKIRELGEVDLTSQKRLNCLLIDLEYPEIGKHGKRLSFVRILVKILFFLPPITIGAIVGFDLLSLYFIESAYRGTIDTLLNSLWREGVFSVPFVKLIVFEVFGGLCAYLTWTLCRKYNNYFQAEALSLHQFRRELDYTEDKLDKLITEGKQAG